MTLSFLPVFTEAQQQREEQYRKDFDYFLEAIQQDYCYWDKKQTDWARVKTIYAPALDTVHSRSGFVTLLEDILYELYDHHAGLSTNTSESQRLVPTGTDLWAEYNREGKPVIVEVRRGFGAFTEGLKPGMEIKAFNDIPIDEAIKPFLGKSFRSMPQDAKNYALRVLLAGKHNRSRKITINTQPGEKDFYPDEPGNFLEGNKYKEDLETKIYDDIGYIRINNSLGNNDLISSFDSALLKMQNTKALILDLRETPSGGNTTVARAILGSFITKDGFYQKHELTAEQRQFGVKRSWVEIVSPRSHPYIKPLVVLVDHWTGSVGEGIAIGFDALKRATVIGTKMAGLNGAIYSYTMPNTGIGFSFPVEKLFHVNGLPREDYVPGILVKPSSSTSDDILNRALQELKRKQGRKWQANWSKESNRYKMASNPVAYRKTNSMLLLCHYCNP